MSIDAAGAPSTDSPYGHWLLIALIVLLTGFLLYAFLTRYREDWNGLLRKLTREQRDDEDGPEDSTP